MVIVKKILALILSLTLVFNSHLTAGLVFAQEDSTVSENQGTGEDSENVAESTSSEETSVENENSAEIVNQVETDANTGDNLIDDPGGGSLGDQEVEEEDGEDDEPTESEVDSTLISAPEATLAAELEPETSEVAAENEGTGEDSENIAESGVENETEVNNENEAEVENEISSAANTGENEAEEEGATVETGEAVSQADVVNVVNTNLTGENFWQAIINLFGTSDNDINLAEIEGIEGLGLSLVSVLAQNDNTGDGSINIALANFLSSLAVYNSNEATLTNDVDVLAQTGDNKVEGDGALVNTGDAVALLNLFNLVNTNLTGENWFFGVINLFGELGGDIILPYELQYLTPEGENYSSVSSTNQNTGDGSENLAQATVDSSVEVSNSNEAELSNDLSVSANSGENEITGSGAIQTGNASSQANLLNIVNTNIFGGSWLFLLINNFGDWDGSLVNWWGNFLTIGNSVLAWVGLPGDETGLGVEASNQNTGDGSENEAGAELSTSLLVENDNQASVENNLSVTADTGGNEVEGNSSLIQTGDASATANVFNFLNTNIIGNNWFFGVINIFDSFLGDIIFPRPDLLLDGMANKETVAPGEEITFILFYRNQGLYKGKDVMVTSILPEGINFVSASNGGIYHGGQVVWGLGDVSPGQESPLVVMGQVDPGMSDGDELVTSAQVTTSTTEAEKSNNQVSVKVTVSTPSQASSDSGGDDTSSDSGDDTSSEEEESHSEPVVDGSSTGGQPAGFYSDFFVVEAIEEEKILGASSEDTCVEDKDVLPYVLLFALSSLWLVDKSRKIVKI